MTAEPCPDNIRTRGRKAEETPPGLPSREEKGRKAKGNPTRPPLKGGEKEKGEGKPHPASPQGRRKGERRRAEGRKQIKNARTCVRAFFNYIGLPRTT